MVREAFGQSLVMCVVEWQVSIAALVSSDMAVDTYLVVPVLSMCCQGRFSDGEQEGLTTGHAHDVFSGLVDFFLRLCFSARCFCVSLTLLLRPTQRKVQDECEYRE